MSEPSTETLQHLVRKVFGQKMSADQVEAIRPRLVLMLRNVELLDSWAAALGRTEPAAVHATPVSENVGDA